MNILILTYQGGMAGSTNSINYLSRGLADRGHNVYTACPSSSLLYNLLQDSQVNLIDMEIRSKVDMKNIRQIRDLVRKYDIQIINAQSGRDRYTTILAKLIYRLPVLLFHTRRQTPKSSGNFLQNWFYTHFTDKIIAVSRGVRDELVKLGIRREHIEVIYNGTPKEKYELKETQRIDKLKKQYGIRKGEYVLGCVSRHKQQEQLIAALAQVAEPMKIFFVGIETRPSYEALITQDTHQHEYLFTGPLKNEDTLYFYKLFHLKVLPSVTEGLSQALLEAMAMRVPVIATDAGGNPDLIRSGENGFLFQDNDIETLASHIRTLLNDPKLADKIARNGQKTALEEFSMDRTVDAYEQFFEKMLSQSHLVEAVSEI